MENGALPDGLLSNAKAMLAGLLGNDPWFAALLAGITVLLLLLVLLYLLQRTRRQSDRLEPYFRSLESGLERGLERTERELREEMARGRQEAVSSARGDRQENAQALDRLSTMLVNQVGQLSVQQGQQLETFASQLAQLIRSNEQGFEQLCRLVETRLDAIQAGNAGKLDEMRQAVDEKLHATLEQRLGDSFRLISERLEQVLHELREMQALAAGVGDLKKSVEQHQDTQNMV